MARINLIMIRKEKLALFRLQKISESSSPTSSPKRKETVAQRLNPMALTSIALKDPPPSHKNTEISRLQEDIMAKRLHFTLWEDANTLRTTQETPLPTLFIIMVQNVRFLAVGRLQVKQGVLRAVRKGRKGVVRWMLGIIKELFWILFSSLSQRRARK